MSIKNQVDLRVKATQRQNIKDTKTRIDDLAFALECWGNNVAGDGEFYKELYRNDFVFNKSMDSWMAWADHHWQIDKMGYAVASVAGVAAAYTAAAIKLSKKIRELDDDDPQEKKLKSQRKAYNKRAWDLKDGQRANKVLFYVHNSYGSLAIDGSEVDRDPWKLPCVNGVINLKTGELEPGRQEDYLLKASPVAWPDDGIDADSTEWENTLLEIFSGNQNLVDFFRQICGYALVGEVFESVIIVMTGRGRNGKSMIVETISKILGQLAGAIRSEMLLEQSRSANSSAPSPDIMALRGNRMAFASETDEGRRISSSRVKWLTGNDTLTGRNPHDKYEVRFKPSHTIFLLTNNRPKIPAEDFAMWERMILFPFEVSFVDREPKNENEKWADPKLAKRLENILPNILAWMVRGCLEWQRAGRLKRPSVVRMAVKDYQRDEDNIGTFIEDCCVVGPEYKVGSSAVYSIFETWWPKNISNRVPKHKWFGNLFSKRFEKRKTPLTTYFGVGLLDDSKLL